MGKKIIFFSIDRLGDYLIKSNTIFEICKKFDHSEIICSDKNFNLIKTQGFFNKKFMFDTKKKTINKLKFITNFFFCKFHTAVALDGKNISTILLFLIRANYKYIFVYKKKRDNLFFKAYCKLLNKLNIRYFILYSRDLIESGAEEHYPRKFSRLNKYFGINNNKTYYLEELKPSNDLTIDKKFILIHLDEKFKDILNINLHFDIFLKKLSNKTDYKIILTSFNNYHNYYKNLDIQKIPFSMVDQHDLSKLKLLILEDVPLEDFYNLIKKSSLNISCHAGFLVHSSLLNNIQTIDILNENDVRWLNTWITKNEAYKIIYKSKKNKKISIGEILNNLISTINEI